MKETQKEKGILQWHPAFYAGLQIELEVEADRLIFENEHQLGTKPREIDVLIVKKEKGYRVRKNIGRIFRTHNIIEYKSPSDYLSTDDFYRVYGYACFYKSDTGKEGSIPSEEMTLTFVCARYPAKLIRHLNGRLGYSIHEAEPGIYYTESDMFPLQFIITSRLSEKENLWLKSLTDDLKQTAEARRLVIEYRKSKNNPLYRSVMDIIVRANREKFQEVKKMCTALEELMKEEIEEGMAKGMEKGIAKGMAKGMAKGEKLVLISQVQRKVQKNRTLEGIASELEEEPSAIADIYDMVKRYPGEGRMEIYQRLCEAGSGKQ